ncbi:NUDIX domain-containing protein [Promicromonospora sukumoe]|uniref:NUDIX domain-containing protein n=1 Tax=Promicromonospora sukumoe TaxID=88382 RepID=UPI0037C95CFD
MTNEMLRARREAMSSPSGSGAPMSRSELAGLVNEYIRARTGRSSVLAGKEVGRWERGEVRRPGKLYRDALRAVLGVASDEELGFFPAPRGLPRPASPGRPVTATVANQVTARALVQHDGRILVLRQRGLSWSFLPGGSFEPGTQSVQGALLGHVAEQTGLDVTIVGFAGLIDQGGVSAGGLSETTDEAITLVFEARATSTSDSAPPRGRVSGLEIAWLAVADLADTDVRPVGLREALLDGADGAFWRTWI